MELRIKFFIEVYEKIYFIFIIFGFFTKIFLLLVIKNLGPDPDPCSTKSLDLDLDPLKKAGSVTPALTVHK